MSIRNSKEGVKPAAIILPFIYGALGLIVLFAAGSRSGSGVLAVIATCLWFLFGAVWFARRFSSGWLFIGILMNLPLWLSFVFLADAGQFEAFFWGLVACLGIAYLGVFLGRWCSTLQPRAFKRVFAVGLSAAIVILVILFVVSKLPTSIPGDKQVFVGQWKSATGFELDIESDGTARIVNNRSGSPEMKIEVGPNSIEELNVHFAGDTLLEVTRPSYYGKTYRIDRYPYRDGSAFVMVLSGTTFRRSN